MVMTMSKALLQQGNSWDSTVSPKLLEIYKSRYVHARRQALNNVLLLHAPSEGLMPTDG